MTQPNRVSDDLLALLQCPVGKAELAQADGYLVCTQCGLRFPIRDAIPVLIAEQAVLPAGVASVEALQCGKPTGLG